MFQTKVSKGVLLQKIKEEISKLEVEWGEDLYKENQSKVGRNIDSISFAQNLFTSVGFYHIVDLKLEETFYNSMNDKVYEKSKLRAIKRKDRLLNISGIINLTEGISIDIDEDTYSFIFKDFDCKKFTYPPFEESDRYNELLRREEELRNESTIQRENKHTEACGPDNTTTGDLSYDTTKPLEPRVIKDGSDKGEKIWALGCLFVLIILISLCVLNLPVS